MEDLKSYLDKKGRVAKLDSALLFLSSSISLLFGIIQSLSSRFEALLLSIPVIILGWGLPFYVGYWLGAITRDSAIDRFRGWVFLLAGLGSYGFLLITQRIIELFPTGLIPAALYVAVALPFIVVGTELGNRFRKLIFSILDQKESLATSQARQSTTRAAFFIAVFCSAVLKVPSFDYISVGILALALVSGGYNLIQSEYYAKNIDRSFAYVSVDGRFYNLRRSRLAFRIATPVLAAGVVAFILFGVFSYLSFNSLLTALTLGIGVVSLLVFALLQALFGVRRRIRPSLFSPRSLQADSTKGSNSN